MFSQAIYWCGLVLELLLLARAVGGQLARRYALFYIYISFILVQDVVCFGAHQWMPQVYPVIYWTAEFLSLLCGCAVVFEIYRVGLSAYPGTARMARHALTFVFGLAAAKGLADAWNDPRWWVKAATTDIEAALRAVQAVAILALIALFLAYSVPLGRNLKGILLGYGFFVGWNVASLPFVSSANSALHRWLSTLYPISYFFVLCFWLAHLWSFQPSPQQASVRLEDDYQNIARATRRRLQSARGYLVKAVRP